MSLATWAISREMYSLFVKGGTNPYYKPILLLGSMFVGGYCCLFVRGFRKLLVTPLGTLMSFLALSNGIRGMFRIKDIPGVGEWLSYVVSYGVICLILATSIDFAKSSENK